MTKDPAFLFYYQDFAYGTRRMTFEEKGAYIELLCEQADSGHLSLDDIKRILKDFFPIWDTICSKFMVDDKGLYYNKVLDEHIEKRKKFTESRKMNLKGSHMDKHMESHMVNTNTNVNVNTNKDINKEEDKKHKLQIYISKLPNVAKLTLPTFIECERLLKDYGWNIIETYLLKMENYKPLASKSSNTNLTIRNWLNKDGVKKIPQKKHDILKREEKKEPVWIPEKTNEEIQKLANKWKM